MSNVLLKKITYPINVICLVVVGTVAGNAHLEKGREIIFGLCIPLRYCHSCYSFVHQNDLDNLIELIGLLVEKITREDYVEFINYMGGYKND